MNGFNSGHFELSLRDTLDNSIKDEVRITFDNHELSSLHRREDVNRFPATFELAAFPKGRWTVFIQPTTYRALTSGLFINVPSDGTTKPDPITLFIHAHLAKPLFPNVSTVFADVKWEDLKTLLNNSSFQEKTGEPLWELLINDKPLLAASVLNLYARTKAVTLRTEKTIFSYFQKIKNIEQDRLFVIVDNTLLSDVRATEILKPASGLLHKFPDPFKRVEKNGSFKTSEKTGNVQVTFAENSTTGETMVDTDVDDHAGIKHAFDVLRHVFTGEKTHPYDIHQILTFFYKDRISLGYDLVPR